ncbi:HAD family hydrolase [Mycoplasma struthionis]|uniref:Cof-type HAD-IIB family hydrolase n=1 Tax=Mycoplasma struthionis TaxID=538220 RepID=A0A3G8LIS8_9MOLU|nr:HAD family hydrolase [Mycoplasma struthionis]AZG68568.1 Cof-type HAD-IIB family hydrolase [Mycoplasma struthionis]TPI02398.1 Cof-type HAD-IIB family hydrolase [Mycoplasma struthionis]
MLKFQPKIFFLDLDGTFLDDKKSPKLISDENVEAMKKLNDSGIPVILSTGRGNSEFVLDLANRIHSQYVICQNGGLIVDKNNNILAKHEIKKDTVMEIIDILKKENLFFIFNSGKTIYCPHFKLKLVRAWLKKLEQKTYEEVPKIENSTKILTFGKTKKGILKLRDDLASKFNQVSLHVVSKGYSIEINDIDATKGKAEKFVCDLMNIDSQYAVHLGDSGNDTTTVPYIGAFVAMKNSQRNVKKQAAYIGFNYKKAGVARTIEKIMNKENK